MGPTSLPYLWVWLLFWAGMKGRSARWLFKSSSSFGRWNRWSYEHQHTCFWFTRSYDSGSKVLSCISKVTFHTSKAVGNNFPALTAFWLATLHRREMWLNFPWELPQNNWWFISPSHSSKHIFPSHIIRYIFILSPTFRWGYHLSPSVYLSEIYRSNFPSKNAPLHYSMHYLFVF